MFDALIMLNKFTATRILVFAAWEMSALEVNVFRVDILPCNQTVPNFLAIVERMLAIINSLNMNF